MNNQGFSLLEMMIVVAITAILASIGISNYQVQMVYSRRDEAKNSLAEAYMTESFFAEANGYYTPCLGKFGLFRVPSGQLKSRQDSYFALGFSLVTDSNPKITVGGVDKTAANLVADCGSSIDPSKPWTFDESFFSAQKFANRSLWESRIGHSQPSNLTLTNSPFGYFGTQPIKPTITTDLCSNSQITASDYTIAAIGNTNGDKSDCFVIDKTKNITQIYDSLQ